MWYETRTARLSVCAATLTLGLLTHTVQAQENTEPSGLLSLLTPSTSETPVDDSSFSEPFAKGTWSFDTFVLATSNINHQPHANFFGGGIGLNYYLKDGVALRAEFIGLGIDQGGDDAAGAGFNLLGRYHFYQEDRLSFFAEGGAGVLETNFSVPDGPRANNEDGTNFNFTLHAGLGANYRLQGNTYLTGALRYMHVSNAGIDGSSDRNPGLDSIGGYVGLMFTF